MTLIAKDTVSNVDVFLASSKKHAFCLLRQNESGIYIAASVQRIEDINHFLVWQPVFNLDDLQMLSRDKALTKAFLNNEVKGAYLGNNITLGNWFTSMEDFEDFVPAGDVALVQLSNWKPADLYSDLRPVRNELIITVDAIQGLVSRANLVYKMEIRKPVFPGSSTYELLDRIEGTEAPPRVENGITYLDGWQPEIGWMLDSVMDWTLPDQVGSSIIFQNKAIMPFLITTWAEQNNVEIVGSRSSGQTLWAIKAKINEEDFANWSNRIFSNYIGANGKWITWQPNEMEVDEDMPIYMSFVLNRKPTPVTVFQVVHVTYENGDYTHFALNYLQNPPENALLNVPMGYKQLGIDQLADVTVDNVKQRVKYYTTWLVDETSRRISRKRKLVLDYSTRRNVRYLIFNNSFGGVDSVRMLGASKEGLSVGASLQSKGLNASYKTSDEEFFARNKRGDLIVDLNSGKTSRTWLEYLQELAWAERVLMLAQPGLVALVGDRGSYDLPNNMSFLESRDFVFKKSKTSVGFSKMPLALTDASERPTAWLPAQPYCLSNASTGLRTGMLAYNSLRLHYIDVTPPEPVRNVGTKDNVQGSADYVAPIASSECVVGTAAFYNTLLSQPSTFTRNNCANGFRGGTWTIIVAANTFGGDSLAAANARALEEYNIRNTQANANLNGTCTSLASGLDGRYRNYTSGIQNDPAAIFATPIIASRVDVHINNPQQFLPAGINSTFYAIQHDGFLQAVETGNIVLQLEHLHGVRMWVNDVLVINNWGGSGISETIVPMIIGNFYKIRVQYAYRNSGSAVYKLNWGRSGNPIALVPAFACFR